MICLWFIDIFRQAACAAPRGPPFGGETPDAESISSSFKSCQVSAQEQQRFFIPF